MLLVILIFVVAHVVVQVVGLCWRIKTGGRIEHEILERFNRIESKLDELLKILAGDHSLNPPRFEKVIPLVRRRDHE